MLNRLSAGKTMKAEDGRPTLENLLRLLQSLKGLMERLSWDMERSGCFC